MIISISNLKPGMIVAKDIYTTDGKVCILRNGVELTDTLIRNLVRYKVKEVSVTLSPELMELMKYDVGVVETINAEQKEEIYEALIAQNVKDIVSCADMIVSKIINSKVFYYDLNQYKVQDDEFKRSIRVAIFAAEVANKINFVISRDNGNKLKTIGLTEIFNLKLLVEAALFYRIGSLCQDKREFERITRSARILPESVFTNVTQKAFVEYDPKMITLYSYNMLSNMGEFSVNNVLKLAVAASLEQPNGNGPLGAIPSFMSQSNQSLNCGKIIKACDEFDKMLQKYINSGDDLNIITDKIKEKAAAGEVDSNILDLLLWILPIYSVGCKVILSDGSYAVVESTTKSDPYKPVVRIISSDELVNLAGSDLSIKSIVGDEVKFSDIRKENPVVLKPKM